MIAGDSPSGFFLVEIRIHGSTSFGKSSSKPASDHHAATTMSDCWHDVPFNKMLLVLHQM